MAKQAKPSDGSSSPEAIAIHEALPVATDSDVSKLLHYVAAQMVVHTGPLPDPLTLKQYRDLDPEIYEIIVRDFRESGPHRRKMETSNKLSGISDSRLSLIFGGILGMAAMSFAAWMGIHDKTVTAVAFLSLPVTVYLTSFIRGSNDSKNERMIKNAIQRRLLAAQQGRMESTESSEDEASDHGTSS